MAANTGNNRIPVKWVRDKAKAAYQKEETCYVCGTSHELELHHFNSITILLEAWATKNKYDISTDAGILSVRDEFITMHHEELYTQVRTFCNKHHVALHRIFGKAPPPNSLHKQERWVEIQKSKASGIPPPKSLVVESFFSAFT